MNLTVRNSVVGMAIAGCVAAFPLTAAATVSYYDFEELNQQKTAPQVEFDTSFENLYRFVQITPYLEVDGKIAGGITMYDSLTIEYQFTQSPGVPTWNPGSWQPLTVTFDGEGGFAAAKAFLDLTPGLTYWIGLRGNATPGDTGAYTLTLAPVPEPENWAMMFSGLAVMGFVASRRRPRV